MTCAWKELLSILPPWLAQEVDKHGGDTLQELRLRLEQPPQLICKNKTLWLSRVVTMDELNFCINTASRYSPWVSQSSSQGYITAPGGHRIGICGSVVMQNGMMSGVRTVRSICIRIARDFPGIAHKYGGYAGSILIIGPPGSGKTTLLRDLIRHLSERETVSVIDERGELFPDGCFAHGKALDILSGCPKLIGINILLKVMGPDTIATDEITSEEDCNALMGASWCGVRLVATAHAATISDLRNRSIYKPLIDKKLFDHILIIHRDKTIREERMIP